MPNVPPPITSPPSQPNQPYDATAPGSSDSQSGATTEYNASTGDTMGGPWQKVQSGGACDMSGNIVADWPGDGTSDGSAWKQA